MNFRWLDDEFTRLLFEDGEIEEGMDDLRRIPSPGPDGGKKEKNFDKVLMRFDDAISGLGKGDFGEVVKKLRQAKRITKCGTCKEDIERTVIDADYVKKLCAIGGDDCNEGIDSLSERIKGLRDEYGVGNGGGNGIQKNSVLTEENFWSDEMDTDELDKKVHRKIMFTSKNCGGCRDVKEQFKNLEVDMGSIEEIDVDSDEGGELADKYKIMRVPGFVLLDKKGNILEDDFENIIDYLVGDD